MSQRICSYSCSICYPSEKNILATNLLSCVPGISRIMLAGGGIVPRPAGVMQSSLTPDMPKILMYSRCYTPVRSVA